jgi:carbon monoxide dehydrogenase subunit G
MKVRIERTFPMPADSAATWSVLSDIPAVASCMPGAKVTAKIDDTHYKGTVSVKLGPANLSFRGEIEVLELNAETRTMHLVAKGTDTTGSSVASMDLTARVEAGADGKSALAGAAEASVGGKAAAFGNRMMDAVSDQILKQFAANFAVRVAALPLMASQAEPAVTPSSANPAADQPAPATSRPASGPAVAPSVASLAPQPAAQAAPQLNGLALIAAIIRDWFRGLFAKRN